jgi:hypothetical protein
MLFIYLDETEARNDCAGETNSNQTDQSIEAKAFRTFIGVYCPLNSSD